MTSVAAAPPVVVAPIAMPPVVLTSPQASIAGLHPPILAGLGPDDALGQMLFAIQRSGENNMAMTETRIQSARQAVREQLDKFMEQLQASLDAAKKAEEDDGGLFGDIIDFIGDALGAIVGTIADFAWDTITLPIDVAADIVTHLDDPGSILSSIKGDLLDLVRNGDVADSVSGFTSGIVKFTGDVATFAARLATEMTEAAVTGKNVWDAVKGEAARLWDSLKTNILENPQFWEVMSVVGKAAAVAGAVLSGGTLACVAVGLLVLSEVDKRTGFIESAVGKDAAPWVRLGIGLAAMVCTGFSAFSSGGADLGSGFDSLSPAVHTVQGATTLIEGVGTIYQGYRIIEDSQQRADDLDRKADMQATLNRMQQLQRMVTDLLDLLRDQNEDQKTDRGLASDLVQTQAATNSAAIVPA